MNRAAGGVQATEVSSKSGQRLVTVARPIVEDLMQQRPWIMWTDFLLTLTVAYTTASTYLLNPFGNWLATLCFPIAVISLYRLSMFIHEIVHFRQHQMPGFAKTWNLIAGVPLLMPSFIYESHIGHHSSQHYGTERDGEYLPLGLGSFGYLVQFLLQIFILPLYVFCRFLVAAPISLLHPKLRRWTLERYSSLVINFRHRREIGPGGFGWFAFFVEMLCMLRAWALVSVVGLGIAPWTRFPAIYLLACCALGLNHLRTMAAHRYCSDGDTMSHDDQFLDSTNVTGNWLTGLICPLGLRFHALHHLLPSIPYYHLAEAHRRLSQQLPADSPYHQTTYRSYSSILRETFGKALERSRTSRSDIQRVSP